MIKDKKTLKYYLLCDKVALKIPENRYFPRPIIDVIWKYEILLRKTEYYKNTGGHIQKILYVIYRLRMDNLGNKLGIYIKPNCFGPGLSIAHYGSIIINPKALIGKNCRIHECVTIGSTNGSDTAPVIGDNCFIGSGAKIIGDISIADDVAIGAGAVVVRSVTEKGITIGGVPAKKISSNNSHANVVLATMIIDKPSQSYLE